MATDPNQWQPFGKYDPWGVPNPPPTGGNAIVPIGPATPTTPAEGSTYVPGTQAVPPSAYPPGSDVYDWHTVNAALEAARLGGWQIAGTSHKPVNQGRYVKNPAYEDETLTPNVPQYILQESNEWIVGVVNPTTGQMLKVTLGKSKPDAAGNYSWQVLGQQEQGKVDPASPGYKDLQRIPFADGHEEMWGTNTQSGAFERLPTQPAGMGQAPTGWSGIKQVEQADGSMVWMGVPPPGSAEYARSGGTPVQVPGMPVLRGSGKYDNIRQVQEGGRIVYKGHNKQTDTFETIPELGSEPAPITTTTVGGRIYKPNPNAGPGQPDFVEVTGIAQPQEGDPRWVDAGGGYVRKETYHNGVWSVSTDPNDYKPISPEVIRATGAIKPAGTRYQELINGYMVDVVADGNGGYTIPPDAKARRIPGTEGLPSAVATSAEQEYIAQRNPVTGAIEQVKNPNWVPSTVGDRTRQLQQLATQKQKELYDRTRSQTGYTSEQADADFEAFWQTEIEPRREQLAFDQEQERLKAQTTAETQRAAMLTQARAAGQEAVSNYQAMQPYMVGPGFEAQGRALGQSIRAGTAPPVVDPTAYKYQMPDLNALAQHYTARALQHISPTAAGLLGGQPTVPQQLQGVDLNALLNRTQFMPSQQPTTTQPIVVNIGSNTGGAAPTTTAAPATSSFVPPFGTSGVGTMPTSSPVLSPAEFTAAMGGPARAVSPATARAVSPAATRAVASSSVPGFGYDPSAMAARQPTPGFGYDPSNIPLQNTAPVDFGPLMPGANWLTPGFGYDPSSFGR